jgi:hypothetical protein
MDLLGKLKMKLQRVKHNNRRVMKRNFHCTSDGFSGQIKNEIAESKNSINCISMKK